MIAQRHATHRGNAWSGAETALNPVEHHLGQQVLLGRGADF